jgi:RNA polymerase sigma-70 factor (ECF subfamily)
MNHGIMPDDTNILSDEEVVQRVRSSDQELFATLIERYQERLLRYALALVRDEHQAADIVQESFIKAFINLRGFDAAKKFSSWMYRIVHNEAMNAVRRHRKEVPFPDDLDVPGGESGEEEFEQKEMAALVTACLDQIPLTYSEPLALRYLDERTYDEISDILRLPVGTVATRVSRAKLMLKKICKKNQSI